MHRKLILRTLLLGMVLSLAGSRVKADLLEGLLIWHDFGNLVDGSGNGHDLSLGGDARIADGLLWLDGDEDYADVGTPAGFDPVNPLVDALSDFTIAIAYAGENTGTFSTSSASILVSMGTASGSGDGDFVLTTHNDGQAVHFWDNGTVPSQQSGVGYADGTVHLVIVTYDAAMDLFTFYHLDGAAGAVSHGDSTVTAWTADWSDEWDETLNYGIRLGLPYNDTTAAEVGAGFFPNLEGRIDLFAIWNRALDPSEMPQLPDYRPARELASRPSPGEDAALVGREPELAWSPGIYAQSHNVYFGTRFDDVDTADSGSEHLVSSGQAGTLYDPPGLLDWGQTYYWRVDEVNAPARPGIHKGETWSFTVEPYVYPLGPDDRIIAVSASSFDPKFEPNNTLNGSGLDANDLHDANEANMWLSERGAPEPAWIQYEFDKTYKLNELMIWNYNRFREDKLGYGFQDVTIEVSTDGTNFTALDPVQLEPATGNAPVGPALIPLNGINATHLRLTAQTNFKGRSQFGLSEIRLLYLPARAREPDPASGAVDVDPEVVLRWHPGREAASHEVHLGTEMNGLPPAGTTTEPVSVPQGLVLDETYYWRIDEVNDTEDPRAWEGDLWHFTTAGFRVVDDFEAYTDDNTTFGAIFQTWIDGLGFSQPLDTPGNDTGSIVGYALSPFAERVIVHEESRQSMPFEYDNTLAPRFSEATRTFDLSQDWSVVGIRALTLYVFGRAGNGSGQLYVKINGSSAMHVQGIDLTTETWQEGNMDLADFSALGVDLKNVRRITIGVEGSGHAGSIFIDDIRLYPSRCIPGSVLGDLTGDCVVDAADIALVTNNWLRRPLAADYTFDNGLLDSSGQARHGKGRSNPLTQNGVLTLNGSNAMDIPLGADNPFDGSQDFSVVIDFKTNAPGILLSSARDDTADNHAMAIYLDSSPGEPFWAEVVYENFGVGMTNAEDDAFFFDPSLWHSVILTYDADSEWVTVYLDGVAGEGNQINPAIPNIGADTVRVGSTLNTASPNVEDFVGDIDTLRIFNLTLAPEDIMLLPRVPIMPGDVNQDGLVDQQDKDIVEANMGATQLWP